MFDEDLEEDELDEEIDSEDEELDIDDVDDVDDLDVDDDDLEVDAVVDDDSAADDSEPVGTPARAKRKTSSSVIDLPSVEAKQKERDELAKAMEEFLQRGGKVQEVDDKIDV